MNKMGIGILIAFILLGLGIPAAGLAQAPPASLSGALKTIVTNGYEITYTPAGWGSTFNLPQSQFSVTEEDENSIDFQNDNSEFGEIGLYVLALQNLTNPQLDELDLPAETETKITQAAEAMLPWVWTPSNVTYGTHDTGLLPNEGVARVVETVQGVSGANSLCIDTHVNYNAWSVPKDTVNKQMLSTLSGIASTGETFLAAARIDEGRHDTYLEIATHVGDNLLTLMVTPDNEAFGIHSSETTDRFGHVIPNGLLPYELLLKNESTDTASCTDGGTIKLQESRKTFIAQAALFLTQLAQETDEEKYARAAQIMIDGILDLQECDGTYKDYMRWDGGGTIPHTCRADDGETIYEGYPSHVVVGETQGFVTDNSVMLYLLAKADPELYSTNANFKRAVNSLLELEEDDIGSGIARNGDPVKYASYSLPVTKRPYAQVMLANVFLRASCVEASEDVQKRMQGEAYDLLAKANTLIPSELDAKVSKAISPDVGNHLLAVSAAADAWKIIEKGCNDCKDGDGDGSIDGVCAGDTVKYDCNDSDPSIHPGATEVCDGIDNDCDGNIDDGFDADHDQYATCESESRAKDCNDESNEVYPGAPEAIDNVDNDCDAIIDNTGLQISLLTDANVPIPNVDVVVIDYGNPCANSFATLVSNIPQIKAQCSTAGTCTTDANGMCLAPIKKDGKFQVLADIPKNGLASNPIEFQVGTHPVVLLQTDANVTVGNASTPTNGAKNPFTSNPYLLAGFVLLFLIVGGLVIAYLVRTGAIKLPPSGGSSAGGKSPAIKPHVPPKPASRKMDEAGSGSSMLSSPKTKEGFKVKLPKLPSLSAQGLASKIVGTKSAEKKEERMLRPGNFPKKPVSSTKPRKVWKDE